MSWRGVAKRRSVRSSLTSVAAVTIRKPRKRGHGGDEGLLGRRERREGCRDRALEPGDAVDEQRERGPVLVEHDLERRQLERLCREPREVPSRPRRIASGRCRPCRSRNLLTRCRARS